MDDEEPPREPWESPQRIEAWQIPELRDWQRNAGPEYWLNRKDIEDGLQNP